MAASRRGAEKRGTRVEQEDVELEEEKDGEEERKRRTNKKDEEKES